MHVCIVVDNFFGVGGTETNVRLLAERLEKSGHRVYVVTIWRRIHKMRIKVHGVGFKANKFFYNKKNESFFNIFVQQLMKMSLIFILTLIVSLKEKIDIIHAHMALPVGFIAVISGIILRKPVVVSVRGSDLNVFAHKPVLRTLVKFTLKRAEAIIALSYGLKKEALKLGACSDKVFIIPNGVDPAFFGVKDENCCRSKLNVKTDDKVVLFVGTIESYRRTIKGFEYLLSAMKPIIDRVPKAKLIAVGVPPLPDLTNAVSKLGIENHVSFVGVVRYEEIPIYFGACNVFVLPSLKEGLPTTVLEAMASAKPIVASDIEGCRDLIENGINGFLVPPGQMGILAEKIIEIITNDELAARLGKKAREIAETRYSWDSVIKKTLTIYERILRRNSN